MEVIYNVSTYFSSTLRNEARGAGKSAAQEESILDRAQGGDSVDISQQGRKLQRILAGAEESGGSSQEQPGYGKNKSNLMSYIDGDAVQKDNRLAYNGPGSTADSASGGDNTDERISELQTRLREAMQRLQEARQELTDAQAQSIEEVKAMQNGENPADMSSASQQQVEQSRDAAQQKVASAQAEVNSIQEQLQKLLSEKNQQAQTLGMNANVGGGWSPQGTTDYIRGDW